ncbi:hypothetical protein HNY73_012784 [Argiope bruennichi]|uniref:Uncharacterized protein n=1 Tax=Argiope bruennichi TaxID=94029 RepID=A0A8T0EXP8_ARGBR|nr:hypothetical protein HNY73_012784 [Argiope bruennichi]
MAAIDNRLHVYYVTVPVERHESGVDNPFRPDGELSREAETIVNLSKKGKTYYPCKKGKKDGGGPKGVSHDQGDLSPPQRTRGPGGGHPPQIPPPSNQRQRVEPRPLSPRTRPAHGSGRSSAESSCLPKSSPRQGHHQEKPQKKMLCHPCRSGCVRTARRTCAAFCSGSLLGFHFVPTGSGYTVLKRKKSGSDG